MVCWSCIKIRHWKLPLEIDNLDNFSKGVIGELQPELKKPHLCGAYCPIREDLGGDIIAIVALVTMFRGESQVPPYLAGGRPGKCRL